MGRGHKLLPKERQDLSKLVVVANTVLGDERCYGYAEIHEQSPKSRGFHRYRVILVNRNDEIAEYREDMGLAKNFKGINPIAIPSYWEHTVDELRDLADELRGQPKIDVKDFLELDNYKPA